jgi:hypothetical protein
VVGRPLVAPAPAAALTPVSDVPFGVLEPPARGRRVLGFWFADDWEEEVVEPVEEVALVPVMKFAIAAAASTGPVEVRPKAEAFLVPSSRARMMEVSASEPQRGLAQSRGVPSATVELKVVIRDMNMNEECEERG